MFIRFIYTFLIFNIFFIKSLFAVNADMQPSVFEDSNDLTPAGSIFYYHIKLQNNTGTDTNETVTIKIDIPIGFEYNTTNFTDECDYNGATPSNGDDDDKVICEFDTFAGNSAKDINITVKAGLEKGVFKSIAEVFYEGDENDANNLESVKTTVVESADIELVEYNATNSTITSSGIVTYKMVVRNNGPFDTTDIDFKNGLPSGLEFYSDDASSPTDDDADWDCSVVDDNVTCHKDTLAKDEVSTFYFRAKVNTGTTGEIATSASVEANEDVVDVDLDNNIKDTTITVIDGTDVSMSKFVKPNVILENETAQFILNIKNEGYMEAEDILIQDTIPDGHIFNEDNITLPADWSCSISGQDIECSYDGNLTAGYDDNITIDTTAPDLDTQDIDYINSASISTTSTDTDSQNDISSVTYKVWVDQANVKVSKEKELEIFHQDGNPITVGNRALSKIIVKNRGPREATPIQIIDYLDENESYVSYSGEDWNCSENSDNHSVVCDYANTLQGTEESSELIIKTEALEGDYLENCVEFNNSITYPDINLTDQRECAGIYAYPIPQSADLVVTKDTNDTEISTDENSFEYYIDIKNIGEATAKDIKFHDKIPQYIESFNGRETTNLSVDINTSSDNYSCIIDEADINCTIDSLDVNESIRVTIVVSGAMQVGLQENNATAFSITTADPIRGNNEGNVSVNVDVKADIMVSHNEVTYAEDTEPIRAGTNAIYNIQVTNNGPGIAKDVNLTNTFNGEEFKIVDFDDENCSLADDNLSFSCFFGDMDYKEQNSVVFTIRPKHKLVHNEPWDINNSASVTMSTKDINLSNNELNETLPIRDGEVDLSIEKDESGDFVEPIAFDTKNLDNNKIVYKITINNFGPSEATNIKFIDKMRSVSPFNDQNVSFLGDGDKSDGSDAGFNVCKEPSNNEFNPSDDSPEINCTISSMESGDSFVKYFTFKLLNAPHRIKGDVYLNEINVTSDEIETTTDNNFEDERTTVRTFADLEMNKTASTFNAEVGEDFNFTFDIYNYGPGYAPNTILEDTLPEGMILTGTPIVEGGDDNGSCSGDIGDTSFSCNLNDAQGVVENNQSRQVVAPVKVISYPSSGDVNNSANIYSDAPDNNNSNNESNFIVGVYKPAKIGNRVWLDTNANGIADSGEIGVEGVVIKLLDENKVEVISTTTDSEGIYNFDINHSANYYISIEPNSNYFLSPQDRGSDDTNDSDINSSKITDKFWVSYGENNQTIDIGLYEATSLGNRVWIDDNGNGVQDSDELNVPDVNLTLQYKDSNGDWVDGVKDVNGDIVEEITTNSDGEYLFDNLIPNEYRIVINKSTFPDSRYVITTKEANGVDDNINSDSDKDGYIYKTLISNEENLNADIGIFIPVSIGDRTWIDYDYNGIQDINESNVSDINVTLWYQVDDTQVISDIDGNTFGIDGTIETNSSGEYLFENLKPDTYYLKFQAQSSNYRLTQSNIGDDNNDSDTNGTDTTFGTTTNYILTSDEDNRSVDAGFYIPIKIGGKVWKDKDYNGTRESSEDNVSDVLVNLIIDGTISDKNTSTDENGSYIFDDLTPNHSYGVKFSNLPENYLFTAQDIGSDINDSDANEDGETIQTDIMYSGDSNLTLDAGIYDPIIIGDFVWEDSNYNGIQDSGEDGVEGVLVKLVIDDVVQDDINTTTDTKGKYYFARGLDLKPDHNYSVEFVIPNGWFATKQNIGGDDTKDSDGNANGKGVESVRMYSHDTHYDFDMGIYRKASLGNRVWIDKNGNGLQDSGEDNVTEDINITLYTSDGIEINSTSTETDGTYLFSGLNPDSYFVIFDKSTLPTDYVITEANISNNSNDLLDSDANITTGQSDTIFLSSGEDNRSVDMGIYRPVYIGDKIWIDTNADGIQDSNENNYSTPITVTLVDINGREENRTVDSNSSGYLFKDVRPGSYYLDFVIPNGYEISPKDSTTDNLDNDINIDTNRTSIFDIISNEDNLTIDLGIYQNISLGDRIWYDTNMNGVQDDGEANISVSVTVELYNEDDTLIDTNITTNGEYQFNDFTPDNYYLKFSLPDNYAISPNNTIGSDDNNDSDINSTMRTDIITMGSNDKNLSIDVGMYELASIGDRIWLDKNANGIQDDGENNVTEDITVTLYYDNNGTIAQQVTTNSGSYHFRGLIPTDYNLSFTIPDGYYLTNQDIGVDVNDSDVNLTTLRTITTNLETGENDMSWDMGIYQKASLGNRVWIDLNANGLQDSGENNVSDINITLYLDNGVEINSTQTNSNGEYLFSGLVPDKYYILVDTSTLPNNHIFTEENISNNSNNLLDSDINATGYSEIIELSSNEHNRSLDIGIYQPVAIGNLAWIDEDGDGQQDNNEANLSNVQVSLWRSSDNTQITTDLDGNTLMSETNSSGEYKFDNLKPDIYYIKFEAPTNSNFVITLQDNSSSDNNDSDTNVTAQNLGSTIDYTLNSGDYNDSVDAGFYIPVKIGSRVWIDRDYNGIADSNEENLSGVVVTLYRDGVDTTISKITDENGSYIFDNLAQGHNYSVRFDLSDINDTGHSYRFTQPNIGNDINDSDVNITNYISDDSGFMRSGDINLSIDGGVYEPVIIGDRVWYDINGNGVADSDENGVENVTITLVIDGVKTDITTETNSTGEYLFDDSYDLKPNRNYSVIFSNIPTNYIFTIRNIGSDLTDNDANASGEDVISTGIMYSNDENRTLDAGIYIPASLGNRVWIDSNGNGVADSGEDNVTGVEVRLFKSDGTQVKEDVFGNIFGTDGTITTDENGYIFQNLKPDIYFVEFNKTSLPTDYIFTEQNITGSSDLIDSDVNVTTGISDIVELSSNENNRSIDAGIYKAVNLGNRIWEDINADGIQDNGELNTTQSITITLYDTNHREENRTITTTNGEYLFTNVRPGNYQVEFSLPTGYKISYENIGSDDLIDNDINSTTKITESFDLISNQNDLSKDMGIYQDASLGDRVWEDINGDGIANNNELNVSGVTVELYLASDNTLVDTTTTNGDGEYLFENIRPQRYYLIFSDLDTDYIFTLSNQENNDSIDSDVDENGKSDEITLISNEDNRTIDAGIVLPITIGDRVWVDTNANGVQDIGENNYTDTQIDVTLYYENNNSIYKTTTTTANGDYKFEDVIPNSYYIGFEIPSTYYTSPQNIGEDSNNSDTNNTGYSDTFIISSGDSNLNIDMGIYQKASLGNVVWIDSNGNGLQDNGELNASDVNVTLYDGLGNEINSTQTTTEGGYIFRDLIPNKYFVVFDNRTLPSDNYIFTEQNRLDNDTIDSDVNVTNGISDTVILSSGENNLTIDAGIYEPIIKVGDRIWEDTNANGIQDIGEGNYSDSNITITLVDNNSLEPNITISTNNGEYIFSQVRPGNYHLEFSLPTNYHISFKDNDSNNSIDSDIDPTTKKSDNFDIVSGVNDLSWDMGIYQNASLGDRVWIDRDGNGIQDNNELNVSDVNISIYREDGSFIATQQSDGNGSYLFTELKPDNYYITAKSLNSGYIYTLQNIGDDINDSDVNSTGVSDIITLSSNEHNRSLDIGIVLPTTIGDRIWIDLNANGIAEDGENNSSESITIRLYDINGTVVDTNITTNGEYEFRDVVPSNYYIEFDIPNNYFVSPKDKTDDTNDSDFNSTGFSDTFAIYSGENNNTIDIGIFEKASIGDRIWYDRNMNGIQDSDEGNVSVSVSVKLIYEDNNSVAMSQTTTNGEYKFEDVIPNNYIVEFSLPSNYALSPMNSGGDNTLDSDVNRTTMRSGVITILNSGDVDYTIDIGIYELASIGDRVWIDSNANGVQDGGEPNYNQPIKVTLYNSSGNTIATQDTVDGLYKFTRLTPASYSIGFELPNGYILSSQDIGGDGSDSDVDKTTLKTISTDLEAGENDMSWDMGIYRPVTIGDRIWLDINANGIADDGESNFDKEVKVTLYNSSDTKIKEITTTNGSYEFSGLKPSSYYIAFEIPDSYFVTDKGIGDDNSKNSSVDTSTLKTDTITLTSGAINSNLDMGIYQNASLGDRVWFDNNGDGIQDINESEVDESIIVKLYDSSDKEIASQEIKDGKYKFEGLKPNEYYVSFIIPNGYTISPINRGDDISKDSDVDNKTFRTITTQLISNEDDMSWDLGIYQEASIGDRIWLDSNANGLQDINESNINMEINVTLYDINGSVVDTITTNNGEYIFQHLVPVEYFIEFSLPKGYEVSPNLDSNITINNDINSSTLQTDIIKLSPRENNRDIDMGIYKRVSIGDRVWLDENLNGIQDSDEYGVEDIKVTLLDSNKNEITSTTTNRDGLYSFDNLIPNNYYIQFSGLADEYKFTLQYQGSNDEIDSNVNIDGLSEKIVVISNENNLTIDAGIHLKLNANNDIVSANVSEIKIVDILANDSSNLIPSSIELTIEGLPNGSIISEDNQNIIVPNEGLWSVVDGKIKFIPNKNFFGDPTPIEYIVKDIDGHSVTAKIFIDYPPVAIDDIAQGKRDEIIVIPVLANDVSSVEFNNDTLRIISDGKEVEYLDVENEGEWFVNDDGTIKFIPISDFKGKTTPISYTVVDNNGDRVISNALIYLSYPEVRDDIVFADENSIAGRDSIEVNIFDNDPITDPDLTTLQIIGTANAGDPLVVEGEGVWKVAGVKIIFIPNSDFLGDPTPIEYRVANYNGDFTNYGKISIFYPLQTRDDNATITIGSSVSIDILNNDNGDIDTSTIELSSSNPDAIISINKKRIEIPDEGVWEIDESGVVTYIPSKDCDKSPTPITYTVYTPNRDNTSTSTIRINIDECNCGQSDSASSFNIITILLTLLLTLLLIRREEFQKI